MNTIIIAVLSLIGLKLFTEALLIVFNSKHVKANAGSWPKFKDFINENDYKKSTAYTLTKHQLDVFLKFYGSLTLMLLLFSGILQNIFSSWQTTFGESSLSYATLFFCIFWAYGLLFLPFEYYKQFVIENKFGFNKSTVKLWVTDKIKGSIISAVFGIPIITVFLNIISALPDTWWLWGSLFFAGIQVLLIIIYPKLILPFFNKLTNLEEGSLRDSLNKLSTKAGFPSSLIQVIDGSKRSAHSNAYFSGFGKSNRIVLYDTLLKHLNESEIAAVLAHEIGHYKRKHIVKLLLVSIASTMIGLKIASFCIQSHLFYAAFGFNNAAGWQSALFVFFMLWGTIQFFFEPILHFFSRKYEYEADDYAAKLLGESKSLISSLKKLHSKNLSNLTPHPFYSFFYYSHPTLFERETALMFIGDENYISKNN